jgi:hypothetical protein
LTLSFSSRPVLQGKSAARATIALKTNFLRKAHQHPVSFDRQSRSGGFWLAVFAFGLAVIHVAVAQSNGHPEGPPPDASVPITMAYSSEAEQPLSVDNTDNSTDQQPSPTNPPATPPAQTNPPANPAATSTPADSSPKDKQKPAGSAVAPDLKGSSELGQEQLKKQEKQRVLGVIPAFNSVYEGTVPPLTPKQKFYLMYKSTTDAYVFAFAALTAGIGQAQNSHAGYGQGVEGYAKRFGANYVDTADGNFWGNAVLPIVLHEDPRYFRLGHGTYLHRALYSMSTTVWCKRDNGTAGPNYANVLGNFIAGGISNLYYPAADRGVEQTVQSALTVTAEGMIGAALIEFWPDITNHYHLKRQAKRDAAAAAARNAQQAKPLPIAPQ